MKNDVGIKQIASELGLSLGAVSRGLRDCADISEATKERIRLKAISLGYVPNIAARNLATGKSNTVAVLLDSLSSPYFGMVSEWFIKELRKHGYQTLLLPVSELYATKTSIKDALEMGVAGIVTFLVPTQEAVEFARLAKKPLLLFGRYVERKDLMIFYNDDEMGGEKAAEYLIKERQKKRLVYIGASQFDFDEKRNHGFLKEAQKLGVAQPQRLEAENLKVVSRLANEGYDGFFCFDDQLACRAMSRLEGQDVAVVGYNGTSHFFDSVFDITSIEGDYTSMVASAVMSLIEAISGVKEAVLIKKFPVQLYIGQS